MTYSEEREPEEQVRLVSRHHEIQLYAPDVSVESSNGASEDDDNEAKDGTKKETRFSAKKNKNMAVVENFTDNKFDYEGHKNGGIKSVPKHRKRTVSDMNQTKHINSALDNIDTIRLVENPAPSNIKIKQKSDNRGR